MNVLTQDLLRLHLHYCPANGLFTWVRPRANNVKAGDTCKSINSRGYVTIGFVGQIWQAHRLAWLYMTGNWPEGQIDHINCIKSDNRWANLRIASRSQNAMNVGRKRNNTSGVTGVQYVRRTDKWQAYISIDGIERGIGAFESKDAAAAARELAARAVYGDFYREGSAK